MDLSLGSTLNPSFLLALTTLVIVGKLLDWFWFRPKILEKLLRKQGFNGNPYRFFIGDFKDYMSAINAERTRSIQPSDNILPHIYLYYNQIINKYGKNFFMWFGPWPIISITDPVVIKEILTKPEVFPKPLLEFFCKPVSTGVFFLKGHEWSQRRKVLNPAFHLQKLKCMVPAVVLSSSSMIGKWEALVSSNGGSCEIDVWPYLQELSGHVVSRAVYGSSNKEWKTIHQIAEEQIKLAWDLMLLQFIPGWSF